MPERKGRHPMPHHQTDPAGPQVSPEKRSLAARGSSVETNIQSFIVKVWLGEVKGAPGRPTWRGYITHVPSGRRRYLKKLGDVTDFMGSYINSRPAQLPGSPDPKPIGVGRRKKPSLYPILAARKILPSIGVPESQANARVVLRLLKQNKKLRSIQKRRRKPQSS